MDNDSEFHEELNPIEKDLDNFDFEKAQENLLKIMNSLNTTSKDKE